MGKVPLRINKVFSFVLYANGTDNAEPTGIGDK